MKANQLATLVLRLLGIYCLILFISTISGPSSMFFLFAAGPHGASTPPIGVLLIFLLHAIQIVPGILLIAKSVPWGEKLMPGEPDQLPGLAISFEQVQVLVFAAAGILIFAGALPQLLNSFYLVFTSTGGLARNIQSYNYNWHTLLMAVGCFLKAALGLYLFFRARRFAGFWRSLKDFGTPKPSPN